MRTALIVAGFLALSIAMTWPLGWPQPLSLPHSDDAYFNVWRISWVAHQLPIDPRSLFDANIFYPEKGALAFSDAMLLVGLLGAPFLWLGIDPVIVHNGLLIAAFFSSAVGAVLLARQLGASTEASVIAGVIFGFAPYRFGHIAHLELQWVVWMPLAMMALRKLADAPTATNAMRLGLCVAAQTFSSIYYGVFLCVYLAIAAAIEIARSKVKRPLARASAFALVPLLLVALVYGPPYSHARSTQGSRPNDEQQRYSATARDLLRVPEINRLRGRSEPGISGDEMSLYPGVVPIVLGAAALVPPISTPAAIYGVLGLVALDGALGMNANLFPALERVVPAISSFRSPARFMVLVLLSLAVLAAIGLTRLNGTWPRWRGVMTGVAFAICLVEYWSAPIAVRQIDPRPSEAHEFLAQQPPGSVVLELPVPKLDALWLYESTYELESIHHWQPLVNGYSGFAPGAYRRTIDALQTFPSESSIARLQQLDVRFIVINRRYYMEDAFASLLEQIEARPEFWPPRAFGTQLVVVELKRPQAAPRP